MQNFHRTIMCGFQALAFFVFSSSALALPSSTNWPAPNLSLELESKRDLTTNAVPYIDIVNQYIPGLKNGKRYSVDSYLESTALDTVVSSNGTQKHKLHNKVFGQVLAPGREDDFRNVFVGGWICERPELLPAECAVDGAGWLHISTGHVDNLLRSDLDKIGCAWYNGIWACDLA